jgi:hypothetical protein
MATQKQRGHFFRLWAAARAEVCEGFGLSSRVKDEERDGRHRWIRQHTAGRTEDINAVRPGNEFSRLMLQTALAAGDYREAAYWELDVAKRWRWFMENLVRQLGEIARKPAAWEYVQGIFAHLRLPASWQDIPEGDLENVWKMLDTHRRRLLTRDHGWQGLRKSDRDPLGFFAEASYVHNADGELGILWLDKSRPSSETAEAWTEESGETQERVYQEVPA